MEKVQESELRALRSGALFWFVMSIIFFACAWIEGARAEMQGPLVIEICGSSTNDVECKAPKDALPGDLARSGKITGQENGTEKEIIIGTTADFLGVLPAGWTENGTGQHPPGTAGAPVTHYTTTENCGSGAPVYTADDIGAPNGAAYVTWSNACRAVLGGPIDLYTDTLVSVNGTSVNYKACLKTNPTSCSNLTKSFGSSSQCPPGYTNSSGTCTLSNESLVMKPSDSKCGVVRSGNTIGMDSKDPDCTGTGSVGAAFGLSAASGTASATAGGGTLTVAIDPTTGNVTITSSKPTSSGNTEFSTLAVAGSGSGVGRVTGTTSGVTAGTGTLNDPGTPVEQTDNKIDEAGTPTDGSLSAGRAEADAAQTARTAAVDSVAGSNKVTGLGLSLGITWPSAVCSNPTFGVLGQSMVVDICSWAADVGAITDFIFTCGCAFYLFVLGAGALKI